MSWIIKQILLYYIILLFTPVKFSQKYIHFTHNNASMLLEYDCNANAHLSDSSKNDFSNIFLKKYAVVTNETAWMKLCE